MAIASERPTLRNLYLYLVCLFTLVVALFATVNLVRATVELFYPDPGYYATGPLMKGPGGRASEGRQRERDAAQESQRRQSVLGLVGSGTTLLIAGPLYAYHWRRVQRELSNTGRSSNRPGESGDFLA